MSSRTSIFSLLFKHSLKKWGPFNATTIPSVRLTPLFRMLSSSAAAGFNFAVSAALCNAIKHAVTGAGKHLWIFLVLASDQSMMCVFKSSRLKAINLAHESNERSEKQTIASGFVFEQRWEVLQTSRNSHQMLEGRKRRFFPKTSRKCTWRWMGVDNSGNPSVKLLSRIWYIFLRFVGYLWGIWRVGKNWSLCGTSFL